MLNSNLYENYLNENKNFYQPRLNDYSYTNYNFKNEIDYNKSKYNITLILILILINY